MADATVIIVAQRVGTIMHADRIIVLEDGTIAAMGTHDELLETSETYREIVASQLGSGGRGVSAAGEKRGRRQGRRQGPARRAGPSRRPARPRRRPARPRAR